MQTEYHVPIMVEECINALNVQKDKLYFDGTLGGGGHSLEILKLGGRLIATDKDGEAIDYALMKFTQNRDFTGRFTLVRDDFKNIKEILSENSIDKIDGALLDLGISSHQIDAKERGFSYMSDALLDMRMDRNQFLSAMTVVNEYLEEELANVIYSYGEERASRRIAREIVNARNIKPIETTKQLADIVKRCVRPEKNGSHPAKRTFQAIRIEVNRELFGLKEAIEDIADLLSKGSRIAVMSFHSLEDRIVKSIFKEMASGCICDKSIPVCVCGHTPKMKLITSKGIRPGEIEQKNNKRSASAILRVAEKL